MNPLDEDLLVLEKLYLEMGKEIAQLRKAATPTMSDSSERNVCLAMTEKAIQAAYAIDFAAAQRTIQMLADALGDCEKWLDGQPRRSECVAETQMELLGSVRSALDTARKGRWIK